MYRRVARALGASLGLAAVSGAALAHGGTLRNATPKELAVPTWLFLLTGGAVVGASFLLASFVTERAFVEYLHGWRARLPAPRRPLAWVGRLVGLVGFALVVWTGLRGPADSLRNAAIMLVWVGWWAGFAMTAYLVGNTWPAVDPFRTLTRVLPDGDRDLPPQRAAWASAAFLLALIWFEVVSPLADDARLLAAAALGYLAVSAVGVVLVGHETWFEGVDPLSRLFRMYGAIAPVQRGEDGLALRLPGARLVDGVTEGDGDVAFVVALLWGTTFDGLVGTPAWASFARAVVPLGVPAHLLYPATLLAGFLAFLRLFRWAAELSRESAPTYTDPAVLARAFAPSLLAIAVGYHLAHYLVYFLSLSPALVNAVASPLHPGVARTLVLPGWLAEVDVAAVLLGHLLAIWVAHSVAYERFPGRLQAIRSQYPLTAAMIFYTVASLWIVSQPAGSPPYL